MNNSERARQVIDRFIEYGYNFPKDIAEPERLSLTTEQIEILPRLQLEAQITKALDASQRELLDKVMPVLEKASDPDGYYEQKPHKLYELVYMARELLSELKKDKEQ